LATLKPSRQGPNRAKRPLYRKRWPNLSPKQKLLRERSLSVLSEARIEKIERKEFKGVRLEFGMNFADPQHPTLLGRKEV